MSFQYYHSRGRRVGRGNYPVALATFISMGSSTADSASYSFTSANFGQVDKHTYALVILANRASGAAVTSTARSVGGVPFSIFTGGGTFTLNRFEAYIARMPKTGPLAVDVTWSGSAIRAVYALFKVQGIRSATPTNTGATTLDSSMSSGVLTGSVDVSAGGCLICFAANAQAGAFSWTNVTERGADVAPENFQFSVASNNFAAAQTALAITATAAGPPSGTNPALVGMAFR